MDHFGYWAVVPPLLAIVMAVLTRQVYLSLGAGVAVGALIFAEGNVFRVPLLFAQWVVAEVSDPFNAGIVVFTFVLGAIIALMQQAGGAAGFARWAAAKAKNARGAQLSTWLLGIFVFIDDYFDTITVGTVMRPVTDKVRVSREKLAFLVDSTAAPVAIIAPISTWVGFIVAQMRPLENLYPYPAYEMFVRSIPFNFYSLVAIVWALVIAYSAIEYGPMRAAERRARERGELMRPGARPMVSAEMDALGAQSEAPPRMGNLIMPILVLVVTTVFTLWYTGLQCIRDPACVGQTPLPDPTFLNAIRFADASMGLLLSSLITLVYAGIVFGSQRVVNLQGFFEAVEVGFRSMLPAIMVLTLAWTIGRTAEELQLGEVMSALAQDTVSPALFPLIAFLLAGVIAFSTGTSFGTFAIMLPITIPVAAAFDPAFVPVVVAATVGGAVFGDHGSPISDTTVLSSMASGCDHIDHVRTQIPYAATSAAIAAMGFVAAGAMIQNGVGLGWTWTVTVLGLLLTTGIVFAIARVVAHDDVDESATAAVVGDDE